MQWFTTGNITLVLSCLSLAWAVYQIIRILQSKRTQAWVVDYDEEDSYDPSTGTHGTSLIPIYRYRTQDGEVRQRRSHYALFFNWLRKDTMTVYVSKSGKVYEPAGVITALISAVIFFLIV